MVKKILFSLCAMILFFGISVKTVFAGGFSLTEHSSRGVAMGGSNYAVSQDASALFYNPASLSNNTKTNVDLGLTLIFPDITYNRPDGVTDKTESQIFYPPHLYVAYPVNSIPLVVGAGFFVPYGLGSKWNYKTPYVNGNTSVEMPVVAAAASYELLKDSLSLGACFGIGFFNAAFELKNGQLLESLSGDGKSLFMSFGVLASPIKDLLIGINYKAKMPVNVTGKVDLYTIDSETGNTTELGIEPTGATTKITLPDSINVGIGYSGIKNLVVEMSFSYTRWESYNTIELSFDKELGGQTSLTLNKNWHNNWTIRLGAEYTIQNKLYLRGGFLMDSTPVPDESVDMSLPESIKRGPSFGIGYRFGHLRIDGFYFYVVNNKRTITNPDILNEAYRTDESYKKAVLGGDARITAHLFGLDITYEF